MKNKGISLIVLIITIVVIVILATTIIVNLAQTNIIGNANAAVFKQDIQTYKDELGLYIADKYADTKGEYDPSLLNGDKDGVTYDDEKIADSISEILSIKNDEYLEKISIVCGELVLKKVNLNKQQVNWSKEINIPLYRLVELSDADISTKQKYNFVDVEGDVTVGNYGTYAITISSNETLKTGDVVYANKQYRPQTYGATVGPIGYYRIDSIAYYDPSNPSSGVRYYNATLIKASSYVVKGITSYEAKVELKDASETLKIKNKFGEGNVTLGGGYYTVNKVEYNGIIYSGNISILSNNKYYTEEFDGMIIYTNTHTTPDGVSAADRVINGGYYKYNKSKIADNSTDSYIRNWEYLGESYLVDME